ncbi:MAG: ArsC/Spx/MgsR family protein [Pyrinomonadaceae bacterium]
MLKLLRDEGFDYTKVNYYLEPLSEDKLRELLSKMKLAPRDIMRKGEAIYRELELGKHEFTDDELIAIMVKNPDLIQRPIVERGNRAVLGRPTENVREIL